MTILSKSSRPALSRRQIIQIGGTAAFAASLRRSAPAFAATTIPNGAIRLGAYPATVPLVGGDISETAAWTYDGRVPGPVLRIRQGQPFRAVVENGLGEDTTVHCGTASACRTPWTACRA